MDELEALLQNCGIGKNIDAVEHDVDVILNCFDQSYYEKVIHMIPFYELKVVQGMYPHAKSLYADVVRILRQRNRAHDLIDLMPFIDDYIEHFF